MGKNVSFRVCTSCRRSEGEIVILGGGKSGLNNIIQTIVLIILKVDGLISPSDIIVCQSNTT
ncbi:hypothetical protein Syun_013844 [Stephania yunnanensis]|uniref:Uncharacterized protein n=1 Tax=Stephania yunnanensis TaxID=152371 RepID=A0AAP0P913_9MAGN